MAYMDEESKVELEWRKEINNGFAEISLLLEEAGYSLYTDLKSPYGDNCLHKFISHLQDKTMTTYCKTLKKQTIYITIISQCYQILFEEYRGYIIFYKKTKFIRLNYLTRKQIILLVKKKIKDFSE